MPRGRFVAARRRTSSSSNWGLARLDVYADWLGHRQMEICAPIGPSHRPIHRSAAVVAAGRRSAAVGGEPVAAGGRGAGMASIWRRWPSPCCRATGRAGRPKTGAAWPSRGSSRPTRLGGRASSATRTSRPIDLGPAGRAHASLFRDADDATAAVCLCPRRAAFRRAGPGRMVRRTEDVRVGDADQQFARPVVRTFIGFSIAAFIGWIALMAYTSIGGGRSSAAGRAPWSPRALVPLLLMSVPLAVLLLPMAEPRIRPPPWR